MYFITGVHPTKSRLRCVGYFSKLEKAIDIVVSNFCDIYENGYYPYVVIENIPEGIYQYDEEGIWFEYSEVTKRYEKCQKPKDLKGSIGYGIG